MIVPDEEVADKVIEELEQGASFNLLAMEYSLDEDTVDEGGYLGYFTEGNQFIPPGYEEKINSMDEQSFSEPFSVGGDVAIIYLHRYLPEINFTYEELQEDITRELALKELGDDTSADILWDKTNVDWVYDEEDEEALP